MYGSWNPSQWSYISNSNSLLIKKGYTALQGILCATSSSLIIQIWDTPTTDADALAVQHSGSITLVAGQSEPMPAKLNRGLYVKVISGSGTFTVYWD